MFQMQKHIRTKMEQTLSENKFTIEETNYKQTHIPVDISFVTI